VHCGTGAVGKHGLRGIIHHPELELVGHYVWSPQKVGIDSGILCGEAPTGIIATNQWHELLELQADCLSFFGDSIGREQEAIDGLCPFLERGTNVVTISAFELAHPATAPRALRDPIEAACRAGNATAFFTGIDPGWATTDMAIAALAVADRVDCVRVLELAWWGHYTAEFVCREYFGFGKPPGFEPLLVKGGLLRKMWEPTLQQIAAVLEVPIDDFRVMYETDCLDHDIETGFGTVRAGTASVVHFELQALHAGRPFAIVEHVDVVGRGAGKRWKAPFGPQDLSYRVEVEGDPSFTLELNFGAGVGGKITAMPAINAIPAVCAAPAGLLGPLDIPRYWTRNARPSIVLARGR
jgi:hypothetical protein